MDDLISRKQAIDAVKSRKTAEQCSAGRMRNAVVDFYVDIIKMLPSAQPEIIYCGDCKYKDDGIDEDGIPFLKCLHGRSYGGTRINDFCSWAEKREVTT